ncbi:MAG TPA: 16S rRNA (adenine(1518)-N(6)/adenine(1519)-N(6))-dimethyltransferase RsmA [Thermoanaerobaculia bacterium]|nr:16S rRNA (adenine(1518)-N(6)/adenine(1519)-N(6))-dimethyltransferase RsmA [Thermoanaerobaculia bacterium]
MHGVRLRKALGQHHLVDGALCRPLVDFLAPAGERVLEIGPGGGVLTGELLAAGAKVLAWELDPAWAAVLRRRHLSGSLPPGGGGRRLALGVGDAPWGGGRRLALAVGDAMDIRWGRLPPPTLVAGNLPYGIATALLERLLPHHRTVPRAAFLVQREVADRLLARPGDRAYGSFSVLVAAYSRPRRLGRVRPGSFRPPPKVEGAFVGLELAPPPLPETEMPAFLATLRLAFAQRRKTLRNALAAGWGRERAAALLAALGLPPTTRAEQLDLAALLALHQETPSLTTT